MLGWTWQEEKGRNNLCSQRFPSENHSVGYFKVECPLVASSIALHGQKAVSQERTDACAEAASTDEASGDKYQRIPNAAVSLPVLLSLLCQEQEELEAKQENS